ncbi:MAG TPA: right-handed parallel beta-helix repeat-containing protein, partial [Planctomycetota bacterium]|nr:right-handed parallel beta-helix repeat-containing protein [Planctomycetota bacterium]
LQLDLAGEPGDKFWLFQSASPGFVYSPARAGVLLVALPALSSLLPHGTLPPSGMASVGDCNSNGVVDPCDVLNGTSLDQNHNWIPDECEAQTTWYVDASAAPGGNGSIGAPFQALAPPFSVAISGDTVLVANGLYQGSANRDLDFGGRNMVVKSTGGSASCIIDLQSVGRAFLVSGGTTQAARIEGFTIKNGKVLYPTMFGAGVYVDSSKATIRECVFQNNDGQVGGGLAMLSSSGSIEACSFLDNKSSTGAGAFVSQGLDVRFQGCIFQGNTGPGAQGGGVYLSQSAVKVERCAFLSNTAHSGGAVYTFQGDVNLDQCLLAGNSADQGGGVSTSNSTWHMTNCTIVGNTATLDSAAVNHVQTAVSWPRVWRNNVVWNNTAPGGTPIRVSQGPLDIDWCDIQGGQPAVTLASGASLNWGAGNRNQDPLFAAPDGADNNPLTVNDNDYRLALGSPCLDAGENASVVPDWFDLDRDGNVTEPVPIDFDGSARFVEIPSAPNTGSGVSPLVDLGAWERP